MSLHTIGKLLKISKKNEKSENEEIALPVEGYEQCIQLLLAYLGQDVKQFSIFESCKCEKNSEGASGCDIKGQPHGIAVLRFLGRSNGLAGADPFEDLEIDQIVDIFHDFILKVLTLEKEEDPELRTKNVTKFKECEALLYLSKFDAVIATNKGHLALNKLTWADFLVVGLWDYIVNVLQIGADDKFSNINGMVDNITSIPSVKLVLGYTKNRRES